MERESCKSEAIIARQSRHLTVGYVRKRHEDRKTAIATHFTKHASLNLSGNWLHHAGFPTGTAVKVTVSHGQLIIELANK